MTIAVFRPPHGAVAGSDSASAASIKSGTRIATRLGACVPYRLVLGVEYVTGGVGERLKPAVLKNGNVHHISTVL